MTAGKHAKTLVIFVHGLTGSHRSWGNFPKLVIERLGDSVEVAHYEYPTSLFSIPFISKPPKIQVLAAGLRSQIENRWREHERLYLICHSLGGIVGRRYLLEEYKKNASTKVEGILMYATPNSGSDLVRLIALIPWTSAQLRQLCRQSDIIDTINSDWTGLEAGKRLRVKYVLAGRDQVVDVQGARELWGSAACEVNVGEDHRSVVKPRSVDDLSFIIFERFLREVERIGPEATGMIQADSDASQISGANPFKGLTPFQESDSPWFFGRGALITALVSKLKTSIIDRQKAPPLHFVLGASGSGKSSLVQAGLVPELIRQLHAVGLNVKSASLVPGQSPVENLCVSVCRLIGHIDPKDVLKLEAETRGDSRALALALRVRKELSPVILVVDQFEELFTQSGRADATAFLDALLAFNTSPDCRIQVIVTMRSDFYGQMADFPALAEVVSRGHTLLTRPTDSEIHEIIEKPARALGVNYEPGLVRRMVDDVRETPTPLPFLEFALSELWRVKGGSEIRHIDYERIGGLVGSIGVRAESLYQRMTEEEQSACRAVLLGLVTPGEGTEDTRRRAAVADLTTPTTDHKMVLRIVALLTLGDARLLVATGSAQSSAVVEIAHEALLSAWSRLRAWIDEARSSLLALRSIRIAMMDWESSGRPESRLLDGTALERALSTHASNERLASIAEIGFLLESAKVVLKRQLAGTDLDLFDAKSRTESWGQIGRLALEHLHSNYSASMVIGRRARLLLPTVEPFPRSELLNSVTEMHRDELRFVVSVVGGPRQTTYQVVALPI